MVTQTLFRKIAFELLRRAPYWFIARKFGFLIDIYLHIPIGSEWFGTHTASEFKPIFFVELFYRYGHVSLLNDSCAGTTSILRSRSTGELDVLQEYAKSICSSQKTRTFLTILKIRSHRTIFRRLTDVCSEGTFMI